MKRLMGTFFNGILTLAPLVVTVLVIKYIFNLLDNTGQMVLHLWHTPYIPGVGMLLTIAIIFLAGWLSQHWLSQKLMSWIEALLAKFPLLKTIYNTIKETLESFLGEKRSFSTAVLVTDGPYKRIGFLTAENLTSFGLDAEHVAVYIPHGLQVSGELRLYSRENIEILATPVEEALRFCLTAGVATKK